MDAAAARQAGPKPTQPKPQETNLPANPPISAATQKNLMETKTNLFPEAPKQ